MDLIRAKEIMSSPQKIDVFYQGKAVWLESLNSNDGTVLVTSAALPQGQQTVPVAHLKED
jgi:small acid-soluble spore protein H (minor)